MDNFIEKLYRIAKEVTQQSKHPLSKLKDVLTHGPKEIKKVVPKAVEQSPLKKEPELVESIPSKKDSPVEETKPVQEVPKVSDSTKATYDEFKDILDKEIVTNEDHRAILKLLEAKPVEELIKIALDKEAPIEIKGQLAGALQKKGESDLVTFISNKDIPEDILQSLYAKDLQHSNWKIRQDLIAHPNFPLALVEEIVERYVKDKEDPTYRKEDPRVLQEAAPKIQRLDLIQALAKDPNSDVQEALIGNPRTPQNILTALFHKVKDKEEKIRLLAANPQISSGIASYLLKEALSDLGETYLNKRVPLDWLNPLWQEVRVDSRPLDIILSVISKAELPDQVFEAISKNKRPDIRLALLTNKKLPISVLEKLTGDLDLEIKVKAQEIIKERKSKKIETKA